MTTTKAKKKVADRDDLYRFDTSPVSLLANSYDPVVVTPSPPPPVPAAIVPSTVVQRPAAALVRADPFDATFPTCEYICFCFRKPDQYTSESWLNLAASLSSYYIHIEPCLYDASGANTKALHISRKSNVTEFISRDYHGDRWEFVWVKLTIQQRRAAKAAVHRFLFRDNRRTFASCNIFCFHLFALPCYCNIGEPVTRTCAELTVELIKAICPTARRIGNSFSYTPEDIYKLLQRLDEANYLKIEPKMANSNPKERLIK